MTCGYSPRAQRGFYARGLHHLFPLLSKVVFHYCDLVEDAVIGR
jgi:hypothetical protein